jgi:hypothetical protein
VLERLGPLTVFALSVLWTAGSFGADLAAPDAGRPEFRLRRFHADLNADGETALVSSPAKGSVDMQLEIPSLRLHWKLAFVDLTSEPIEFALHGPAQPGANGIVQIQLAQKGARSPVEGTTVLNDAQAEYMLSGWSYVDVATARYPKGEIRSQVKVQRPTEADR